MKAKLTAMAEKQGDLYRQFIKCFDNPNGKKVLEYLDAYSKQNYPNYENVNATFSKIGEQTLVSHIKGVVFKAKHKGE